MITVGYRVKDERVRLQFDTATEGDGADRLVERFKLFLSVLPGVPLSTQLLTTQTAGRQHTPDYFC